MTAPTSSRSVAGDSASSAVWTLASRITGFVRVVLVGAVLGPSFVGNLFQLANQLPWLLFEITVGSLLGSLLVPALMRHIQPDESDRSGPDLDALGRLVGAFATTIVLGFALVSATVIVLSPILARVFALGVPASVHADLVAASIPLIILTAPQLVGYGLTVTAQSVQQAMGSFAFPAGAAIVENVVVVATLITYAVVFETSTAVAGFDTPRILLLGIGSSLGVAAHVVLQWFGVKRLGLRVRPSAGWRHPEVRAVIRRAVAATGTAALNGIRILALLILANSVAGGVVALQLGLNLIGVAVALGAKPVAYAVLPRLAVRFGTGDLVGYRNDYERGVGLAGLIIIPAAGGALLLGWLLGPVLAVGAMNTVEGRALLAVTVTAIAGSVVGEAFHQLGVAGSYGRNQTRPPLVAFALRLGLTGALVPLAWFFDGADRIAAIAAAMSVADLVSGLLLHRWVNAELPPLRPAPGTYRLGHSLIRTVLATAVGFGLGAALGFGIVGVQSGQLAERASVIVAGGMGALATLVIRNRFDSELGDVVGEVRGRGAR